MTNIAIVTGSSGNLGQEVVIKFIAEEYKVIGTVTPADNSNNNFPRDCFERVVVDLMNEDESSAFIDTIIKKHTKIDIAVLTVGGFAMGEIANTSASDIYKQYKLNFETTYNIARPVFNQMMRQKAGRIFLIGSKPGMDAKNGKGMIAYGLAKALIFRLAELMNQEAEGHNVVVSVIVPGTIDTPQNRKAMPDTDFDNWVTPKKIAAIISYYASDAASSLREPVIKIYGNS